MFYKSFPLHQKKNRKDRRVRAISKTGSRHIKQSLSPKRQMERFVILSSLDSLSKMELAQTWSYRFVKIPVILSQFKIETITLN